MKTKGFTLLELSIVLVIIGLIVGGILVGREMIASSELRKVVSTFNQYSTAVQTFRLKYDAIPGDMPNATSFFTCTKVATDFTNYNNPSCNGDGNGLINGYPTGGNKNEEIIALEHLYRAGLIPENRDPTYGYQQIVRGLYLGLSSSTWALALPDPARNHFAIRGNRAFNSGAFTPEDAYWLDNKIDGDGGMANTGKFRAEKFSGPGSLCTGVYYNAPGANYKSASDWGTASQSCLVFFIF